MIIIIGSSSIIHSSNGHRTTIADMAQDRSNTSIHRRERSLRFSIGPMAFSCLSSAWLPRPASAVGGAEYRQEHTGDAGVRGRGWGGAEWLRGSGEQRTKQLNGPVGDSRIAGRKGTQSSRRLTRQSASKRGSQGVGLLVWGPLSDGSVSSHLAEAGTGHVVRRYPRAAAFALRSLTAGYTDTHTRRPIYPFTRRMHLKEEGVFNFLGPIYSSSLSPV